ncbi:SH3 domain-containing protein [Rippkaea orientalis]|nr:SH3 domain-containing protein [Rippkaea orientalis]
MKRTITSRLTKIALSSTLIVAGFIITIDSSLAQTVTYEATLRSQDAKARINLRAEPSLTAKQIGYGLPGDKVTILDLLRGTNNQTRFPWIKVKFVKSGAIGWIRGDFVNTPLSILTSTDPKSRINLRAKPSSSSQQLGYGLSGDRVMVLGCETGSDQDRTPWINVKFVKSGATGWIRGDFVLVPLTFC